MRLVSVLALVLLFAISVAPASVAAQPAPPSDRAFRGQGDGDSEPLEPGAWREFDRGGGNNVIIVHNNQDERFRARGNAELDRIHGDRVTPTNVAESYAQCTGCQTISVALQVVLYQSGAPTIAPVNRAVALNTSCSQCLTIARAIQYVIPVDDLDNVPHELNLLVDRADRETEYLQHVRDLNDGNIDEVQAHMDQLEVDFASLQQYVLDMTDQKDDTDTLTPTPGIVPQTTPASTQTTPVLSESTPVSTDSTPISTVSTPVTP